VFEVNVWKLNYHVWETDRRQEMKSYC
jgi:hypothetical protein